VHSNVDALLHKLELTVAHFPWVQMVVMSELASFGPLTQYAQPMDGPTENANRQAAAKLGIWLLPAPSFAFSTCPASAVSVPRSVTTSGFP